MFDGTAAGEFHTDTMVIPGVSAGLHVRTPVVHNLSIIAGCNGILTPSTPLMIGDAHWYWERPNGSRQESLVRLNGISYALGLALDFW